MPLKVDGLNNLMTDIARMASSMDAEGTGAPTARRILTEAAQPIHQQMKANASKDPQPRSGDLRKALNIGKVKRSKKRGQHITIGVHRKDWDNEDYYPAYVEYGHDGPAPAPAHPYSVRPSIPGRMKPLKSSVTGCAMRWTITLQNNTKHRLVTGLCYFYPLPESVYP